MVTNVTNFGRSGLSDWVLQRVSAVILALYTLYMVGYFLFGAEVTYAQWSELFSQTWMRVFTLLAMISIAVHAWIGIWTVLTDYIKPTAIRFAVQALCILAIFTYLVWGIQVLWGA